MMRRNRGDLQPGEPLRDGTCAVCGKALAGHPLFGVCYRAAMDGQPNRGRLGRETVRREGRR